MRREWIASRRNGRALGHELLARTLVTTMLFGAASSCSDLDPLPSGPAPSLEDPECRPSEELVAGACVLVENDAGLPDDMPCPPGAVISSEGCVAAGAAAEPCAEGFERHDEGHCEPVLPPTCEAGAFAIPGDARCRDFTEACVAEGFGDIPTDATTQFVDASYAGGDSDGSASKPWLVIQDAVDASTPGATLAIAKGQYAASVVVGPHPVHLRGTCAADVVLLPPDDANGILVFADGTSIEGITVQGSVQGITAFDAADVVVRRSRVLGAAIPLGIVGARSPASVTLEESLLSGGTVAGALVLDGGALTLRKSAVRNALARGIAVQTDGPGAVELPSARLERSVVEGTTGFGVASICGRLVVEGSVVRNVSMAEGDFGIGIAAQPSTVAGVAGCATEERLLEVRQSLVTDVSTAGIWLLGLRGEVRDTVVRRVAAPSAPELAVGIGIVATTASDLGPAELDVAHSLIEHVEGGGVYVGSSIARLDGVHARDIVRRPHEADEDPRSLYGRALWLDGIEPLLEPAVTTVHGSRFERYEEIGVVVLSGTLDFDASLIESPLEGHPFAYAGGALQVNSAAGPIPSVTMRRSLVRNPRAFGVYAIGADARLEQSVIEDVSMQEDEGVGDGVIAAGLVASPAHVELDRTLIEGASRAGVASFWKATIDLGSSSLVCSGFDAVASAGDATLAPAVVTDDDLTRCGCPDALDRCQAVLTDLAPPDAEQLTGEHAGQE